MILFFKVAANRILDFSDDDDHSDVNKPKADNLFESSDEDSDSSFERIVKPKRNKFVFLDLTCHEVIEDEDHENPDASADELQKICEKFMISLRTETDVQTPAPTKKTGPTGTTKRKLFTHNYDDQKPFEEEFNTPRRLPSNDNGKVIQLKTPIPSYLIPPQFRDKTKTVGEPNIPSKNQKKNQTPRTPSVPKSSPTCGFLESLDGNQHNNIIDQQQYKRLYFSDQLIPVEHCDPDALRFRSKFQSKKNELVKLLMKLFNEQVFDNKLKDVPVSWSKTLRTTAGRFCYRRMFVNSFLILQNPKFI